MIDATPPLKQLNRTFIGSVLFIDIVGYSTRTVPDQLEMKEWFNRLLGAAVQNVAASERIMVDTGDGAAIAFLGDPEDALFAALALRDAVEDAELPLGEPGFVRMGINLGPLKIVRDINGHTNMIGDGVNDAQRVMSFADPGQVMASHSYYDIISRFSRDYTQLFTYEGTRHDKHVREHEVYRFGAAKDNESLAEKMRERSRARHLQSEHEDVPPAAAARGARPGGRNGMIVMALAAIAAIAGGAWFWRGSPPPAAALAASEPPPAVAKAPAPVPAPARPEPVAVAATADAPERKTEKAPEPAPVKPGTVKLAVAPWGEIYVDGSRKGVSPPMKSIALPPGKHRIEVRNGDFAPYRETVDVKSGAETTVQYVF
ncbi:PEGA domain-containing protein [Noviherbaspirillum aridicola]|uniref:Guanylate cyclase domain-containing protein n=1 Tax=Noviherbaspirillum aridicola TaxID=2849687 RepID=A0ABQ4Q4P5_9BURK|nr:PEGA domain-containing protein [Noviherbaspirillum aridicola]GIZ51971.1 hypothetical protein NCCP691_19850 [Noviherbaspirillum aridicola]